MGVLCFVDDHGAVGDLKTFERTSKLGVAILWGLTGTVTTGEDGWFVKTNDAKNRCYLRRSPPSLVGIAFTSWTQDRRTAYPLSTFRLPAISHSSAANRVEPRYIPRPLSSPQTVISSGVTAGAVVDGFGLCS